MTFLDRESFELAKFKKHEGEIFGIGISKSKELCVTGGYNDRTLILMDLRSLELVSKVVFKSHITDLDLSPDNQNVAVGFDNGDIKILEFKSLEEIKTIEVKTSISSLVYSNNGMMLATAGHNYLTIWAVPGFEELINMKEDIEKIWRINFSPTN